MCALALAILLMEVKNRFCAGFYKGSILLPTFEHLPHPHQAQDDDRGPEKRKGDVTDLLDLGSAVRGHHAGRPGQRHVLRGREKEC